MAVARYLGDKSALARLAKPVVRDVLQPLLERGLVATCALVDLGFGHNATSAEALTQLLDDRRAIYPWVPIPDTVWTRAQDVQLLLADRGQHRGVGIPDLLIAATAEVHDLVVLHYDNDFDLIASVTKQRTQWVAPAGTAD